MALPNHGRWAVPRQRIRSCHARSDGGTREARRRGGALSERLPVERDRTSAVRFGGVPGRPGERNGDRHEESTEQGSDSMNAGSQLRIYRIKEGKMEEWPEGWTPGGRPPPPQVG